MKEWAKGFYLSKAWRITRDATYTRDSGLCVRCGEVGVIVHHKTHLTEFNINDIDITLSLDNLELLCRHCHACAHGCADSTIDGLMFNEEGELVKYDS